MTARLSALLVLAVASRAAGQGSVSTRLAGRVSPEVASAVGGVADSAAARGLPVEPLVEKAIEGGAKGVPAQRVIAAVRALAGRLDQAAASVRAAGLPATDPDVIEAGAFALSTGLTPGEVEGLLRHARAPYVPAAMLRVAGTLAALGVPPDETVQVVDQAIDAGTDASDLLDLPREVEAGMAHGATAGAAAAGMSHGQGQGQGHTPATAQPHGPPPGKGQSRKP